MGRHTQRNAETIASSDLHRTVGRVDAVIVSYNSAQTLRQAVEPLADSLGAGVIVVDNASADNSVDGIRDIGNVTAIPLPNNVGFAAACNVGWKHAERELVLFINPDARLEVNALAELVAALDERPNAGAVAPAVRDSLGGREFSIRRHPCLRSTYARAFMLHRLFPRARWADEVVREDSAYSSPHPVDWASGACLLVRRSILERIGGFDERFFLYSEDADLCRRIWATGAEVWYAPAAVATHVGGASAPRPALAALLAASRLAYAEKHLSRFGVVFERLGLMLEATARLIHPDSAVRAGQRATLRILGSARDAETATSRSVRSAGLRPHNS